MATIYYVDPANGDNINDGLTPGTAFADIFAINGAGSFDDVPEYWIRRSGDTDIIESKTFTYGHVYPWPLASDSNFSDRPQEGVDAGWDSDSGDSRHTININNPGYGNIVVNSVDFGEVKFFNIDFVRTDAAISSLLDVKSNIVNIENCTITSENSDLHILRLLPATSTKNDGNGEYSIIDTKYRILDEDKRGSSAMYVSGNSHFNYVHNLTVRGCDMAYFLTFLHAIHTSGYKYNFGTTNLDISDSTIRCHANLARVWAYQRQTIMLYAKLDGAEVYCGSDAFRLSEGSYGHCTDASFDIVNSKIFSASAIFKNHNDNNNGSSYYPNISHLKCSDSEFTAKYFWYSYAYDGLRLYNVDIHGCTFRSMETVFYFYSLRYSSSFKLHGNIYDEVRDIIWVANSDGYTLGGKHFKPDISIVGQSIYGYVLNNAGGGQIYLEGSNVGRYVTGSDCENVKVVAVNSSVDSISGSNILVDLMSCKVETTIEKAFSGTYGKVVSSEIVSEVYSFLDDCGLMIFDECNISTTGLIPPLDGAPYKLVRCRENGIKVPYREESTIFTKEISPIYRINGSPHSLSISVGSDGDVAGRSLVSDIYVSHNPAKPIISAYMTSFFDLTNTEIISAKFSYIENGVLKVVNCVVTEDIESQWDGIQVGERKYKSSVDLSGLNIIGESKIKLIMSLSSAKGAVSLNVDTKLNQE